MTGKMMDTWPCRKDAVKIYLVSYFSNTESGSGEVD